MRLSVIFSILWLVAVACTAPVPKLNLPNTGLSNNGLPNDGYTNTGLPLASSDSLAAKEAAHVAEEDDRHTCVHPFSFDSLSIEYNPSGLKDAKKAEGLMQDAVNNALSTSYGLIVKKEEHEKWKIKQNSKLKQGKATLKIVARCISGTQMVSDGKGEIDMDQNPMKAKLPSQEYPNSK
ncbi:hypothetical protein C8R42DRAFT_690655 [Lentinula raphanica]|nr:hypothetical protein C8R42DRAFT_690655 [Lentinula raphanica]